MAIAAAVCAVLFGGTWYAMRALLTVPASPVSPSVVSLGAFKEVSPPKPLPALAWTDLDGAPLPADAVRGRMTLLNVWATWCAPCVKEMPALERLQTQLGGPGFGVVALSVDRGGAHQVKPFLEKTGLSRLPIALDMPGAAMQALELRGLPTTLLLDAEGREIARFEGAAEWDGPAMVAELRKRMGGV
ncbi:TlpA family protein disulfide reductase [Azospirillum sp. RWY-5-1]|uniref:TlpA family protein disulfide reductase n=2 Tax=Azospirillum oleiclasticum TaxID=2735135 RepID=A0ABX2T8N6_9PROT|nr:TlpA disulfide reductase family protein [Azospirillum oleiclasticum]NYZ11880.1 TlpA family protein disulfide reductase [Azospirillum oleiclasticum]NYZ19040.1 TlpA family protein disulfide reductase [Azospirillum oleiclasticum]